MRAGLRLAVGIGGGGACVCPGVGPRPGCGRLRRPRPTLRHQSSGDRRDRAARASEFQHRRDGHAPGRSAAGSTHAGAGDGRADPAGEPRRSRPDIAPSDGHRGASGPAPPQPQPREAARQTSEPIRQTAPAASVTVALPKLQDELPRGGSATATAASAPGFAADPAAGTLAPERKISFLPWLLAAVALGAGGAFLFYRRRHGHEALAGGPQIDAFAAPEPAPSPPAPRAAPRPRAASAVLDPGTRLDAPQAVDRFQLSAGALRC